MNQNVNSNQTTITPHSNNKATHICLSECKRILQYYRNGESTQTILANIMRDCTEIKSIMQGRTTSDNETDQETESSLVESSNKDALNVMCDLAAFSITGYIFYQSAKRYHDTYNG
uniref:Uncharacterized protein n=1 Tax=Megaviridae environmental sample TaxID=1737588 RepID=A0A5J6VKZ2_9VIRU|nr:MAG: hypothetical protein [Megaviridae environmental sample]